MVVRGAMAINSAVAEQKRKKVKARARADRNPDQLALGEQRAEQAELFADHPGGRQPGARLREIRESMDAIDSLFYEAIRVKGVGVFSDFLEFVRRFNRFSAFNVMLIETQRPGATAIGSREQWQKIDRRIKPTAVPIAVLWPFAPVRWVYELNDTYGRPVPPDQTDPFQVLGAPPGVSWSSTVQAADRRGVRVELTDKFGNWLAGQAGVLHGGADGAVVSGTGRKHRWLVHINGALSSGARFAALAHELGHIYCGHLGSHPEGFWPDRKYLTTSQKEMEAEAVAYLACKRLSIDVRSAEYLKSHANTDNLLAISKRMIVEATNRVEARS